MYLWCKDKKDDAFSKSVLEYLGLVDSWLKEKDAEWCIETQIKRIAY